MVPAITLMNYLECKVTFTEHTDASDKQLGDIIIQNNRTLHFSQVD